MDSIDICQCLCKRHGVGILRIAPALPPYNTRDSILYPQETERGQKCMVVRHHFLLRLLCGDFRFQYHKILLTMNKIDNIIFINNLLFPVLLLVNIFENDLFTNIVAALFLVPLIAETVFLLKVKGRRMKKIRRQVSIYAYLNLIVIVYSCLWINIWNLL